MQKKIENMILIIILVVFIFYFLINYNLSQAIKDIERIDIGKISYIVLAWFLFTASKFLPWTLALKKIKVKLPIIKSFLMMYAFFGIGASSAGIGQLIPLRGLDKFKKNARFSSLGVMFFMGTTGGLAAIILALTSSILLSKFIFYLLFIFAAAYVFMTILGFESPYRKLKGVLKHYKRLKKSKTVKTLINYIDGMRKQRGLMSQRYFLAGTVLFIPSIVFESLLLIFILSAFNVNISILAGIFIFTISVTIGNLSLLPSGLGTEDISLIALMLIFNVPGVLALAALLIFRVMNTLIVIIAGYMSIGLFRLGKNMRN
jgi:uncharacterized membrane protein YbhN (UPF0104 family)